MPQNLVEKIVQLHSTGIEEGKIVQSGDFVMITPAYVMTHDNTGAVIPKFKEIGATKFHNPHQVVSALDHNIQDTSEKNLQKYANIQKFITENGADFYPAGRGIGHQIMCEEGYAFPGTMVVASDSHSNMYGGLGCLGTPVVRTDAAAIWATGKTWWQIPPVVKVILEGEFNPGVTGKDLIIALCGFFNHDEVLNCAVEFTGSAVKYLTVDQRLSIANMTTEWGALAGIFPVDDVTINWLKNRITFVENRGLEGVNSDSLNNGKHPRLNTQKLESLLSSLDSLKADSNAHYSKEIKVNLSGVVPCVSGPNTVKVYKPVSELKHVKIDKAYLVSCVNSRYEDIVEAAKVLKGNKIAPGVKFYVAAASKEVQELCESEGYWQDLLDSGAIPLPPGCGPCIGLGTGLLEDGETGISATNRNFKGRMGSPSAFAYLASPAVVAYSAIKGFIDFNFNGSNGSINWSLSLNQIDKTNQEPVKIVEGFTPVAEGEIIFCNQDNLNTDGIYPGKYTYNDDFTPEQQASVVMENYDPEFGKIVKEGDILAGGFNFGTGSSREQAATALKYRGIKMVIAGSVNETYKRNAINNGFLVIEQPEFINMLKNNEQNKGLSVKTGVIAKVDFRTSTLSYSGVEYKFNPVSPAAQTIIMAGGLENWVKNSIAKNKG
ncbi:MAG: homoaconitase [Ignavibacteriaceae bacterium]|nr:homoaconitase [Ignavibacteriaceae bacterium]